MSIKPTDVNDFFDELGAGVFKQKLAHVLSEVAAGVIAYGGGKRKGKVTIELSIAQLGENEQLLINQKLAFELPLKRGKRMETDVTDSAFFVGIGGEITATEPREENSGQFNLVHSIDKGRK